ncbi:Ig-like domain repeat protein, partial [Nocardia tengchongensis]|uniref:Ig-like domain repeat protein n=1 Tax=Nocardia tengchongensis TaxID=2055889 RepID=UPI003688F2AA
PQGPGSTGSSDPTNPTQQSTITINPVTGATVDKPTTVTAKVNPAAAGGTVTFEDDKNSYEEQPVGADGIATMEWYPETAGKITMKATFSGRDGVTGSTTTAQVTVAKGSGTTTTPDPTTTTTTPPAPDAIMGGQGYRSGETAEDPCSLGFNATDGGGNAVNITAGHCNVNRGDGTRVYKGGKYLGAFGKTVTNGFDYGLINIDREAAPRFKNNYIDTYGGDPLRITGTADPVVGAPVCKSGEITGYTCGKITAVGVPMNSGAHGAWVPNTFEATVCAIPGDSGGPYMTGTQALGLAVGGAWECDKSTKSYAQPIKSVLADNPGLKIRTN